MCEDVKMCRRYGGEEVWGVGRGKKSVRKKEENEGKGREEKRGIYGFGDCGKREVKSSEPSSSLPKWMSEVNRMK